MLDQYYAIDNLTEPILFPDQDVLALHLVLVIM